MNIVEKLHINYSAIEYAKGLLERCESGECVGFTVIEEYEGGEYTVGGSGVKSQFTTAGMLLAAAIDRIEQTKDES